MKRFKDSCGDEIPQSHLRKYRECNHASVCSVEDGGGAVSINHSNQHWGGIIYFATEKQAQKFANYLNGS